MRETIIKKLISISQKERYFECDVVYFLVESFKLLEKEKVLSNFDVIKFYRNWCCHSKLTSDAHKVFKEISEIFENNKHLKDQDPYTFSNLIDETVDREFKKYSFKILRKDIEVFSKDFLDGEIVNFQHFERPLQEIIIDIPLIITKDGDEELFKLEVREQGGPTASPPFNDLTFYIKYKGHSFTFMVLPW